MKCPSITVTSRAATPSTEAVFSNVPWTTVDQWSAVNDALRFHRRTQRQRMGPVFELAAVISSMMRPLHAMAADLAMATCRFCPDLCCLKAAPWFDLNDLLLIHCCGLPLPPGQPIIHYGDVCRYVSPSGCRLPRQQRPWICTWYACPVQRGAMYHSSRRYRNYASVTNDIQEHRRRLEKAFIECTTGAGIP